MKSLRRFWEKWDTFFGNQATETTLSCYHYNQAEGTTRLKASTVNILVSFIKQVINKSY